MEKLLVIPFVVVLAVAFGLLGLVAYYSSPINNGQSASAAKGTVYVQSAIFQDVKLGESSPCSAVELVVTCSPTFVVNPGDSVQLLLSMQDLAGNQTVMFKGASGIVVIQSASWSVAHGSSPYTLHGTVGLSSPQTIAALTLTFSAS